MLKIQLATYLFRRGAALTGRPLRELAHTKSATMDVDSMLALATRREPEACQMACIASQVAALAPYVGSVDLTGRSEHVDEVHARLDEMRVRVGGWSHIGVCKPSRQPWYGKPNCVISTDVELLAHAVPKVVTRICPESMTYSAWNLEAALRGMRLSLGQLQEVCALASHRGNIHDHVHTAHQLNGESVIRRVAERDGGDMTGVWNTYQKYKGWHRGQA